MGKKSNRCAEWGPSCKCYQDYLRWYTKTAEWIENEDGTVTEEGIRKTMILIYCMFRCMEVHCADKRWRQAATINLLHPLWADLRRKHP